MRRTLFQPHVRSLVEVADIIPFPYASCLCRSTKFPEEPAFWYNSYMVFGKWGKVMTTTERQENASALKREMNCCQAVVRAFADTLALDDATLMDLASGFGSGMGTMRGPAVLSSAR